jgi:hypothetical protein
VLNASQANVPQITGSLFGTASWAQSSSRSTTSSYAVTASYVNITGSGVTVNYGPNGIIQLTGSISSIPTLQDVTTKGNTTSASVVFTGGITGSLFGTASWAQSSSNALTASYVNTLTQDVIITGSINVLGTGSFTYLNSIYQTSSVIYSSGSNVFGDELTDVQQFTGSVDITGSLKINGVNIPQDVSTYLSSSWTSSFNDLTASFDLYTSSINSFTESINNFTSSVVTTSSFNSFTESFNSFTSSVVTTASFDLYTSSINNWTSSAYTGSVDQFATTASLNSFTASFNTYTGSNTSTFAGTSSLALTSSYVETAQTASVFVMTNYITNNYLDDATAGAAGIPLGGVYRSGNMLVVRLS